MAFQAGKVSVATGLSRVLGLVREQVMAYFFGAGMATDAFVAAFRVPNLLRDLFAEGALSSAFIPVFKDTAVNAGRERAFYLANLTISSLLMIVGLVVAVGIIFSPQIIYVSAHGFTSDPEKFNLAVRLTRIMFVYLIMVSVSAVFMGILNSFGRFGIPALSPALFNLGMIITPVVLYQYFDIPIYTLAIGVIIGGIGQIVFQLPTLFQIGFRFNFVLNFADTALRRIGRLISPMIMGLSASRINIVINTLLASLLIEGAISYLNFAYRLMHFPLGVFGVALGTVTLPRVSDEVARNKLDKLAHTFHEAIGLSVFLIIPSAVYLAGFGDDLVRLIYERGAFDAEATRQTARALYFYAFGLIGFAGVRVAAPIFYALGDARRPMHYSILAVIVNIVLNFVFIPIWGFAGLAAATSAAGLTNLSLLTIKLRSRISGLDFRYLFFHIVRVLTGALAAWYITRATGLETFISPARLSGQIILIFLQIMMMGLLYLLFMMIFRVREVGRLLAMLKSRR